MKDIRKYIVSIASELLKEKDVMNVRIEVELLDGSSVKCDKSNESYEA